MSILTQEQPMPYVKVKIKGQVTIPAEFRRDLNLKEGDLLEAIVERGGIVLKPKTVVDRYDEEWAKNVLKEATEEGKRAPKTKEEEDAEERRLLALGARQAKKLGIKPQDAEKIVHDYRKTTKRKV
jgi:AbrB family looped-hinge helix DNA binding protein